MWSGVGAGVFLLCCGLCGFFCWMSACQPRLLLRERRAAWRFLGLSLAALLGLSEWLFWEFVRRHPPAAACASLLAPSRRRRSGSAGAYRSWVPPLTAAGLYWAPISRARSLILALSVLLLTCGGCGPRPCLVFSLTIVTTLF